MNKTNKSNKSNMTQPDFRKSAEEYVDTLFPAAQWTEYHRSPNRKSFESGATHGFSEGVKAAIEALRSEEASDNDELGAEFVLVNALRARVAEIEAYKKDREALLENNEYLSKAYRHYRAEVEALRAEQDQHLKALGAVIKKYESGAFGVSLEIYDVCKEALRATGKEGGSQ